MLKMVMMVNDNQNREHYIYASLCLISFAVIVWIDLLMNDRLVNSLIYGLPILLGYFYRSGIIHSSVCGISILLIWMSLLLVQSAAIVNLVSERIISTFIFLVVGHLIRVRQKIKNEFQIKGLSLKEVFSSQKLLDSKVRELSSKNKKLENTQVALSNVLEDLNNEKQNLQKEIEKRIEAEEQNKVSEQRYKSIFDCAGLAIALVDSNGYPFITNEAFSDMLGYSPEELQSMTFADFTHPDDVEADLEQYKKLYTGAIKNYQMEKRYYDKSGNIVWGALSVSLIKTAETNYAIGMVQDITIRKKYEIELSESIKRFNLIINGTKDGIWDQPNLESGKQWWSPRFYELLGYEDNEVVASAEMFGRMLHPADRQHVIESISRYADVDKAFDIDCRLQTKSEKFKWFRLRGISNDGKVKGQRRMVGSITDIHARKMTEYILKNKNMELIEATSLIEEVQQFAKIGLWEVDLISGEVYWSDEVYYIHEVELDKEIEVSEGINFYHPDFRQTITNAIELATTEGMAWDLELKLITAKEKEIWVRAAGIPVYENDKVVRLKGLFMDIDRRKRAEENMMDLNNQLEDKIKKRTKELHAAKEIYQDLYDNAPDMYVSVDAKTGLILECNQTLVQKTGFTKRDIIGKSVLERYHPDSKLKAEKAFQDFKKKGKVNNHELQLLKKEGGKIDVLLNVTSVKDENGNIIKSRSSWSDITKVKTADRKIKHLNNELKTKVADLEVLNKEMEGFSYSVSHDLRSPLRIIDGYSRIMLEDYEHALDEEGVDILGSIINNVSKMSQLIDSLLVFSRIGRKPVNRSAIKTRELIDDVVREVKESSQKEELTINVEGDFEPLYGDSALIRQVFVNIIGNAAKYSGNNEKPTVLITGKQIEANYEFAVKDNGVGFDMKYYDKLFGVFQRLHRYEEFEGTGLGLALVKKILDKHLGSIRAYAEVGKGATFYITIPTYNSELHVEKELIEEKD